MNDITGHAGGTGEHDFLGFDFALYRSGQLDGIAIYRSLDLRAASDRYRNGANIALHFAIDAYVFRAFELAGDLEGLADDGNARSSRCRSIWNWLCNGLNRFCRRRRRWSGRRRSFGRTNGL